MSANRSSAVVSIGLLVLSWLAAWACFTLLAGLFEPWNSQATDRLFRVRDVLPATRVPDDSSIAYVDLNTRSLRKLKDPYPGRAEHARVIRNLARLKVTAQLYDFVFAARVNEEEDRELLEAARGAGSLFLGSAFFLDDAQVRPDLPLKQADRDFLAASAWELEVDGRLTDLHRATNPILTFSPLREAAAGLGFLNVTQDRDGVFRRLPLVVRYQSRLYPSIVLQVASRVLEVTPERIEVRLGRDVTLRGARVAAGEPVRDVVIPIDARGAMVVNYVGPWERGQHYDFADVIRAHEDPGLEERWREELGGRVVVVSDVAGGASDVGPVPTDARFPLSGVHANALHTILTGRFLVEASASTMLAIELVLAAVIAALALGLSAASFSLGMLALALLYAGAVAGAFLAGGVILHAVRPIFLIGFSLVSIAAYRYAREERDKHALRTYFEAYFAPAVVERIVDDPAFITDSAQKKELTILFSDIEGFTRNSAAMAPDALRRFLNEYFGEMTEIVFRWEGTIDKFIGDGLMVFFGDPQEHPDHALRAVTAAQEMQRRIAELRPRWLEEHGMPVRVRIGINTGPAVVGNLGSERRLSYTALGAAVNMAQRLESSAPADGILVARSTRDRLGSDLPTEGPETISVKGFDDPVEVYRIPVDPEA